MSPSPDYTTTTRFGLRVMLGDTLISDGDEAIQALGADIDSKMIGLAEGLLSARPAAGYSNRVFHATDTNQLFYDNGAAWVELIGGSSAPIGTVANYAGNGDPNANWLVCDGRSLLRATYPTLFSIVGVTYGSADGTHFSLPDARGRTIIGAGSGPGLTARTLSNQVGEENHALSVGELASHAHSISDPGHGHALNDPGHLHSVNDHNHGFGGYGVLVGPTAIGGGGSNLTVASGSIAATSGSDRALTAGLNSSGTSVANNYSGVSVAASGSGNAHNNMQPSLVLNKIIRAL